MGKSVMIVGLGDLGGWVLEFLARSEGVSTIITADIREDYGIRKTNCAAVGAGQMGYYKRFEFHKLDVNDIDATTELLRRTKPDVVYTTLTLQSAWVIMFLPEDVHRELHAAGDGPWIPMHLTLIHKLMQAVKRSGITSHVVNSALPDYVNTILWRNGLGPTVGQGNHDNILGEIRKRVSDAEGVPIGEVTVFYIASHALNVQGSRTGAPFFLKIMVRDRDITSKFDAHSLISDRIISAPARLVSWLAEPAVASSSVRNIMAIINDTHQFAHSPGPNGLLGGYPIRLSARGVEVVLPEELTLGEAIRLNTEGARWDGIEEIKDDGTVVLTDESCRIMREMLGYDCKEFGLKDCEGRAKELGSLYKKFAEKHNAPLYFY